MLHKDSSVILPSTFDLLKRLQADEELIDFFLVGGTALALQIGHRYSVDLDLFTKDPIDTNLLSLYLSQTYNFQLSGVSKNTLLGTIEHVKTDFITHAYPLVAPLLHEDDLRIASIKDIGAMKLNAIAHSGQRLKDFIDVYFILEYYPLKELLEAYERKYVHSSVLIALKGLTYFEDIDKAVDPPIMSEELPIEKIINRLNTAVQEPDKRF